MFLVVLSKLIFPHFFTFYIFYKNNKLEVSLKLVITLCGSTRICHLLYLASCNRVKYNLNLCAYDSVLQIFGAVAGDCVKITIH